MSCTVVSLLMSCCCTSKWQELRENFDKFHEAGLLSSWSVVLKM